MRSYGMKHLGYERNFPVIIETAAGYINMLHNSFLPGRTGHFANVFNLFSF